MIEIAQENLILSDIAESGQCFRWKKEKNGFAIPAFGRLLHVRQNSGESGILLDCTEEELERYWYRYFDLGTDYSAIIHSVPEDDWYLQSAARFGHGIRILRQDPWETLITFLLSQRKNIPAIRIAVEKLCKAAGTLISSEEDGDVYAFPSPEQLAGLNGKELAECGLGYRAKYVEWTSHAFCEGRFSIGSMEELTDSELFDALCGFFGIGKKIALCTMLFGFHRMDAFPMDVWMNRIASRYYSGEIHAERYSPWAGIMQQYMFFYERQNSGMHWNGTDSGVEG